MNILNKHSVVMLKYSKLPRPVFDSLNSNIDTIILPKQNPINKMKNVLTLNFKKPKLASSDLMSKIKST